MSHDHIIRYKRHQDNDWFYMPLIAPKAEAVARAKTVGLPELGSPAYAVVEVCQLVNPPAIWSSNDTSVSQTNLEQPLSTDG